MTQAAQASQVLTQHIIQNDPEVRALVKQKLDTQIQELQANLELATAERAVLDVDGEAPVAPAPAKRGRKPGKAATNGTRGPGRPAGRPSGEGPHHAERITEVLTKSPGLVLSDLVAGLIKRHGEPEDAAAYKKTISTYLSKMTEAGRLTTKGERPSMQYFVSKSKKSS